MYRYVLFDLDGTLLPMNTEEFVGRYMEYLSGRVAPYLPPREFIKHLLAATGAMVADKDPARTNQEVFEANFFQLTRLRPQEMRPVFDDFYATDFCRLSRFTRPTPLARKIVQAALEKGSEVVLATNPIFPLVAVKERMRWAGIDDLPYKLVTAYENMHFCKPGLEYYQEIMDRLGSQPGELLMVGNDVEEDLIAADLGIDTFLVEDCLICRNGLNGPQPTHRGSLEDLLDLIRGWQPLDRVI